MYTTGRIDIVATALDPIHHGAGTSGNTQLLRTQEIVTPAGDPAKVPFISGNSLKHMVRDGAARFALDAMGVPDGTLSKAACDLLFSGGTLSKGGGSIDLATARDLAGLFPALSLCGYAAGNFMQGSKLRVDHLHLVCAENAWRAPEAVAGLPMSEKRAGAFRGEAFGTRHEATRLPHVARRLALEDRTDQATTLAARSKATGKPPKSDTTQMIYDFEVVKPGSVFTGAMSFTDVTDAEMAALRSGLSYACEDSRGDAFVFRVGGKVAVGYGRIEFRFTGAIRAVTAPAFSPSTAMIPAVHRDYASQDPAFDAYVDHLRSNRDEILEAIAQAAG